MSDRRSPKRRRLSPATMISAPSADHEESFLLRIFSQPNHIPLLLEILSFNSLHVPLKRYSHSHSDSRSERTLSLLTFYAHTISPPRQILHIFPNIVLHTQSPLPQALLPDLLPFIPLPHLISLRLVPPAPLFLNFMRVLGSGSSSGATPATSQLESVCGIEVESFVEAEILEEILVGIRERGGCLKRVEVVVGEEEEDDLESVSGSDDCGFGDESGGDVGVDGNGESNGDEFMFGPGRNGGGGLGVGVGVEQERRTRSGDSVTATVVDVHGDEGQVGRVVRRLSVMGQRLSEIGVGHVKILRRWGDIERQIEARNWREEEAQALQEGVSGSGSGGSTSQLDTVAREVERRRRIRRRRVELADYEWKSQVFVCLREWITEKYKQRRLRIRQRRVRRIAGVRFERLQQRGDAGETETETSLPKARTRTRNSREGGPLSMRLTVLDQAKKHRLRALETANQEKSRGRGRGRAVNAILSRGLINQARNARLRKRRAGRRRRAERARRIEEASGPGAQTQPDPASASDIETAPPVAAATATPIRTHPALRPSERLVVSKIDVSVLREERCSPEEVQIDPRVQVGESVSEGQSLAMLRFPSQKCFSLSAPSDGVVVEIPLPISEWPGVCVIRVCDHPELAHGICVVCSKVVRSPDPSDEFLKYVHGDSNLMIRRSAAAEMEEVQTSRLFAQRKLILVLDLDNTLVHCTRNEESTGRWLMAAESRLKMPSRNKRTLRESEEERLIRQERRVHKKLEIDAVRDRLRRRNKARLKQMRARRRKALDAADGDETMFDGENLDEEFEIEPDAFQIAVELSPFHEEDLNFVFDDPALDAYLHEDLYTFTIQGIKHWCKLRPYVHRFLEKLAPLYEMHVWTHGTRPYAEAVCELLDPKKKYFGRRIITREDCPGSFQKSLTHQFPNLENHDMVVILDDRDDVWKAHYHNVMKIQQYYFFGPEIVVDRRFKEMKLQLEKRSPPAGQSKKDEDGDVEMAPPAPRKYIGLLREVIDDLMQSRLQADRRDRALRDFSERFLRVHAIFYDERQQPTPKIRDIIIHEKRCVLKDCRIAFSGMFVRHSNPAKYLQEPLWRKAVEFGATCVHAIDPTVTHLICNSKMDLVTEKVIEARVLKTVKIVSEGWLVRGILRWRRCDARRFRMFSELSDDKVMERKDALDRMKARQRLERTLISARPVVASLPESERLASALSGSVDPRQMRTFAVGVGDGPPGGVMDQTIPSARLESDVAGDIRREEEEAEEGAKLLMEDLFG